MFDFVRNNKRISQGFLALITIPFALWGVDSYMRDSVGGAELATVGDSKIQQQDFSNALREQADRMQAQMGAQFDPKLLESKEARTAILDNLVNQRLLMLAARDANLVVDDRDLANYIARQTVFHEDGKFSPERYAALLAGRGMSREGFEYRVRQDLLQQQLVQPVIGAAIIDRRIATDWAKKQLESRDVALLRLAPERYMREAKVDDAAIAAYYEANRKDFQTQEQVKAEFLVLDRADLEAGIQIADAEVEARYKANEKRYVQAETRRASHILLKLAANAPAAEFEAAQAKGKEISAALAKDPKSFADLAKKHSGDPGSATQGGDLGWFGRGAMVKVFEDTVFSLKDGETSGWVRSDFGLHLIRVTGIKPEQVRPLADARGEIVAELTREAAQRKFAEAVEGFGNAVYEQPDSLEPAAQTWKLKVQKTDWLSKGGKLPAPFDNAKLGAALFAADAIERKHNTEAVEVAPGRLAAARVLEHRPAALLPLEQVRGAIMAKLSRQQGAEKAKAEGEKLLARLQAGEKVDAAFSPARPLLRAAPMGVPQDIARAIFKAPAFKLPAYVGMVGPDSGYDIFRIDGVAPAKDDDPRIKVLIEQYQRAVAQADFDAYMTYLRGRYEVKINDKALETATQ